MNELKFTIKTHKVNREYEQPHFYVLSKGLNSGKPMRKPCPNCYVLKTDTEEQKEFYFYLCQALKIGAYFKYYLRGSVILFITIDDVRKVIDNALITKDSKLWQVRIQKLQKLSDYEENLKKQLKLISELKVAILRS